MVMLGPAPAASGTNNQPRSVTPPSTVNPTSCRCAITPPPANTQNPQSAQPNVARRPAGTSGRHTERHQRGGTGRRPQAAGGPGGKVGATARTPRGGRAGGAAPAVIFNPPV